MMSSISAVSASIRNLEEKRPTYRVPTRAGTSALNGLLLFVKNFKDKLSVLQDKPQGSTQTGLNNRGVHPKKEPTEQVRYFFIKGKWHHNWIMLCAFFSLNKDQLPACNQYPLITWLINSNLATKKQDYHSSGDGPQLNGKSIRHNWWSIKIKIKDID